MSLFRILSFLFIGFFCKGVYAEPTQVKGSAFGAFGMSAELLVYADFISNTEVLLEETSIGPDGFFEFKPDLKTTAFACLKIGMQKAEILLEPGRNYNLKITGLLEEGLRNQDIPPFQIPALQIEILNPWHSELNGLVQDFFSFHHEFIAKHSMALLRQRDASLMKEYIDELHDRFPEIDNAWFNNLLTYKIATMEMISRAKGRESIARQYLMNKRVLYDHPIYMDFFKQFFEKHIFTSRIYKRSELIDAMESASPHNSMMEILGHDPLLAEKRIRELVLIKSMLDFPRVTELSQSNIIKLLDEARRKSNYSEHKAIAENLIALLQRH